MNRRNRLIAPVLLLVLCLVLSACGKSGGSSDAAGAPLDTGEAFNGAVTMVLQPGETAKLDEIEGLASADLRGSENYEEIYAWAQAHPGVIVYYTVPLPGGESVENRALSVDLSSLTGSDVDEAIRALKCLPKLIKADLGSERGGFTLADVAKLQQALPDVRFYYGFTLYGQSVSTTDTQINLSHIPVSDGGAAVREAMACMPALTYLDMDSCGVSNEDMAAIRDAFPAVKVVWRIWFGEAYSVRTDVERILASKPSVGGSLIGADCEVLKYCTDVRYLDLGHNEEMDDIGFLAYMPKLEVAVLAMNAWTDLSPIANCKALEYLEIQTNKVTDISALSGLTSLRHLNICNTGVQDISPLYSLTGLERLWIGGWLHIDPEQLQKMQEAAPNCLINSTAGDPTEGEWRYVGYNDLNYTYILHPRYVLLREQFGYEDKDFSFSWNDPLY